MLIKIERTLSKPFSQDSIRLALADVIDASLRKRAAT